MAFSAASGPLWLPSSSFYLDVVLPNPPTIPPAVKSLVMRGRRRLKLLFMSSDDLLNTFIAACCQGDVKTVAGLLTNKRLDMNKRDKRGASGLYYACQRGRIEVVKLLLTHPNIDVNSEANCEGLSRLFTADHLLPSRHYPTPLHISCARGYVELVKLLLAHPAIQANLVIAGVTPLQAAVKNGQREVVSHLLSIPDKVDVNLENSDSDTALHLACQSGSASIVELLLGHPDIRQDVENSVGCVPLSIACQNRDVALIDLLVKHIDGKETP